jgi:hypothetical protein
MADVTRGLLRSAGGALRINANPAAVVDAEAPGSTDPLTRGIKRDSLGRIIVTLEGAGPVYSREATFTEAGAGTYTATVPLPAGATLHDVIVSGVVAWAAATSAELIVGDGTDPDGYYTAVDLKATDLLAGESLSFALAGGQAGAYIANAQVSPRYAAAARSIIGVATSVGAGTAGRTRMLVVYSAPTSADVIAATKAA